MSCFNLCIRLYGNDKVQNIYTLYSLWILYSRDGKPLAYVPKVKR